MLLSSLMTANMILVLMAAADEFPKVGQVGTVYQIAERDALEEIEARADRASFTPDQFGTSDQWAATQTYEVPLATADAERSFLPLHTTDYEIADQSGDVIYPSQFTFNPLEHATLPGRIIVTPADRLEWAQSVAEPADMILITTGNALTEIERTGKSIYALSPVIAERLGVQRVPVIVQQEGAKLVLREFDASAIPLDPEDDPDAEQAEADEAASPTLTGGAG